MGSWVHYSDQLKAERSILNPPSMLQLIRSFTRANMESSIEAAFEYLNYCDGVTDNESRAPHGAQEALAPDPGPCRHSLHAASHFDAELAEHLRKLFATKDSCRSSIGLGFLELQHVVEAVEELVEDQLGAAASRRPKGSHLHGVL